MTKLKMTASAFTVFFALVFLLGSCRNENIVDRELFFRNKGIPMNGSQNVPPNASAATGTIEVLYRKDTRMLSYTITWTGLSGPPVGNAAGPAIGIYGLADPGFLAFPAPPLAHFPGGVAQAITSGFPASTSGTYSGSVLIDGIVLRESDLLNGKFYIMIRTAAFPAGQIRGQIYFL